MHEASRKTTNVTVFSCLAISVRRGMNESGNILMLSVCFRTGFVSSSKAGQYYYLPIYTLFPTALA
jgi:hypothetical protein